MGSAYRQNSHRVGQGGFFKGTELGVHRTETASAKKLLVMNSVTFQKSIFLELAHLYCLKVNALLNCPSVLMLERMFCASC